MHFEGPGRARPRCAFAIACAKRAARAARLARGLLLLLLWPLALGVGCRAPDPLPLAEPVRFETKSFLGSPLSGPLPAPPDLQIDAPADTLSLVVHVYALADEPRHALDPVAQRVAVSMLADTPGAPQAVLGWLARARAAPVEDPRVLLRELSGASGKDTALLRRMHLVLPREVTTAVHMIPLGGEGTSGRLALSVYRRRGEPDAIEIALQRFAPEGVGASLDASAPDEDAPAVAAAPGRGDRSELIVLDPLSFEARLPTYGVLLPVSDPDAAPVAADRRRARGLALLIDVRPAPPAASPAYVEHRAGYRACWDSVRSRGAKGLPTGAPPHADDATTLATARDVVQAVRELASAPAPRRALAAVGRAADVDALVHVALGTDDAFVEGLARAVAAVVRGATSVAALRARRGPVEAAALVAIADPVFARTAPPALEALCSRFAGGLARRPSDLLTLARDAAQQAALAERLLEENQRLLRDSSAVVRLRAFEWLHARGAAPPGYDPFGSVAERRAAIAAQAAALAAQEAAEVSGAGEAQP